MITYHYQRDDQFEMARPIMINLQHHIASQLKLHCYFDGNWILISELTFDSVIIPVQAIRPSPSIHLPTYLILCLAMMIIILILPIIILLLIRNLFKNSKHSFTPINSSVSTASSEMDSSSSHHRYATIRSTPYTKLTSTTIGSTTNHIEGICGNSAYAAQRSFALNFNGNLFVSNERIQIKNRIENRYQLLGGGEVNIRLPVNHR